MKQRTGRVLIALMATAALVFGTIGIADAKNGADDPAGHIVGGHGADDTAAGQAAPGTDDNPGAHDRGGHHKRGKHGRNHRHHGPNHGHHGPNHGHGADDGPNHT